MGSIPKGKIQQMNSLVLILFLFVTNFCISQEKTTQLKPYITGSTTLSNGGRFNLNTGFNLRTKIKLTEKLSLNLGMSTALAGVVFTTTGLLNKNTYGSLYYNQTMRGFLINSGLTLFVSGITITILK